jgi:hypothetical protein
MRIEDGVPIIPDDGDVAFKPEPQPPIDAMAAAVPQASDHTGTIPEGWYSPDTAPDDGKPVWLMAPDHSVVEAVWRHTRMFDRFGGGGGQWREIGFWALRFSGGLKVTFSPIAWRPVNANV